MNAGKEPPESWLAATGGMDPSGWLAAFHQQSLRALDDLLFDRFYFGPLNLTERDQLLGGWLEKLGDSEQFATRLDAAFVKWIETHWGRLDSPAASLVSAWSCALNVIAASAHLTAVHGRLAQAAVVLRKRFTEREPFLGSFSTAPAADPLGFYLAVIAEFQGSDRSLATFWHLLCDLPDGVPHYHGRYALLGLRRLKAARTEDEGTLRAEIVLGLLRLTRAFDRLVHERRLSNETAKAAFRRIASNLADAYPNSPRWREHGLAELLQLPERPRGWVLDALPPLAIAFKHHQSAGMRSPPLPRALTRDPNWTEETRILANELRRGNLNWLPRVKILLDANRSYAELTGDRVPLVLTLRWLATRIASHDFKLGVYWAEEALALAPQDPWSWTSLKDVLLKRDLFKRASWLAWIAWRRFPENAVVRNGLAETLRLMRRYPEAAEIYRQSIELTPMDIDRHNHIVARCGLAGVMSFSGKRREAEALYRKLLDELSPMLDWRNYPVVLNGLGNTLRAAGKVEEAEALYRDSIEQNRANATMIASLAYLLSRQGPETREEAVALVKRSLALEPRNVSALRLKNHLLGNADLPEEQEWERLVVDFFPASRVAEDSADETSLETSPLAFSPPAPVVVAKKVEPKPSATKPGPSTPAAPSPPRPSSAPAQSAQPPPSELNVPPGRVAPEAPTSPADNPDLDVQQAAADELLQIFGEAQQAARPAASPPKAPTKKSKLWADFEPALTDAQFQVGALTAEAHFYVSWATTKSGETVAACLKKASVLLDQAARIQPNDAQMLAEKVALDRQHGRLALASELLAKHLSTQTAAAPLLVQKARVDRDVARAQGRPLSETAMTELLSAPTRLRNLDPVLLPAYHLETALAALALRNGAVRLETAAQAFTNFRTTVSNRAQGEGTHRKNSTASQGSPDLQFHEWLKKTSNQRLFGALADETQVRVQDVAGIEALISQSPLVIDDIEDTIVDRFALAHI